VRRVCFVPTATGDSPVAIEAVTDVFTGRVDVEFSVLKLFTQPNVPDVRAHLTRQPVLARRRADRLVRELARPLQ
jgi:peptidase E